MFCGECGSKIKDGLKFCTACGASIEEMMSKNNDSTLSKENSEESKIQKQKPKTENRKPNKKVVIILSIILVISILSGTIFTSFILKSIENDNAHLSDGRYFVLSECRLIIKDGFFSEEKVESEILYNWEDNNGTVTVNSTFGETYEFDDNGNVLECTYTKGGYSAKDNYSYDDKGNLLRKDVLDPEDGDYYIEYKYDNGKLIEELKYSSNYSQPSNKEYQYDSNGNLIKVTGYDSFGEMYFYVEYQYDNKGKLIKELCNEGMLGLGDSLGEYEFSYEYDENGTLVKRISYKEDKTIYNNYKYDKNGNLVEIVVEGSDDSIGEKERIELEWEETTKQNVEVCKKTHTNIYEFVYFLVSGRSIQHYEANPRVIPSLF